jgi:hypothetical protein
MRGRSVWCRCDNNSMIDAWVVGAAIADIGRDNVACGGKPLSHQCPFVRCERADWILTQASHSIFQVQAAVHPMASAVSGRFHRRRWFCLNGARK